MYVPSNQQRKHCDGGSKADSEAAKYRTKYSSNATAAETGQADRFERKHVWPNEGRGVPACGLIEYPKQRGVLFELDHVMGKF